MFRNSTNILSHYPWVNQMPIGIMMAYFIVQSYNFPIHDFANYFFAGKLLVKGQFGEHLYDPGTFNLLIHEMGYEGIFANYAPNVPFFAIFYSPLSILPVIDAKLLVNSVSALAFIWSVDRIFRYLNIPRYSFLVLPILLYVPIRNSLLFGQPYLLMISLMLEGFIAFDRGKTMIGIILWIIPAALKLTPGVILLYLLSRKKYQSAGLFIIAGISVIFLTFLIVHPDVYFFYFEKMGSKIALGDLVSNGFNYTQQTILALNKYLFVFHDPQNPEPWIDAFWLFIFMVSVSSAVIVFLTYLASSKSRNEFHAFSLWIFLILFLSSYSSSYARIFIVFIWIAIWQKGINVRSALITLLLFMYCNMPYRWLEHLPLLIKFIGLIIITLVFCVSIEWDFTVRKYLKQLTIVIVFLITINIYRFPDDYTTSYPVFSEKVRLLLDYELKDSLIVYHHWNGEYNTERWPEPVHRLDADLDIQENQIYLNGKQITSSADTKKNPILLQDGRIIFMSDLGRGYGFYTLRYIMSNDTTF